MSKYEKGEALPLEESLYNTINPILGPFLHEKLGLTPNGITTVTFFMGFIITYLVLNNNYLFAAGLLIIRQAFDAADGYVARRYNLKSKFGEVYDEFSDLTTVIPLVLYIAYYYKEFIFDNYLAMIPLVMVILLTFLYRDKCIKKENAACKNPAIRHEVLKSTKFLSYFELVCILSLAIVNIGIKRDGL